MHHQEQNAGRNMNIKSDAGGASDRNEEYATGNCRKCYPCYKVAMNLAELCSTVLWKVEHASNKNEYLTKISKQW